MNIEKDTHACAQQLQIVEKYERVIAYLYPIAQSIPRKHGVARDQFLQCLLGQVDLFIVAGKSNQLSRLYQADAGLAMLRFWLRFLRATIGHLTPRQEVHAQALIAEPGAMLGGWAMSRGPIRIIYSGHWSWSMYNSKTDLDNAPADARQAFLRRLAGTINKWRWENGEWVLRQDDRSIRKFGLSVEDFPDAPIPPMPDYDPDARQASADAAATAEQERLEAERYCFDRLILMTDVDDEAAPESVRAEAKRIRERGLRG